MGLIYQNDFSAGWCPSDDYVSGRKNGLLAMTNCVLNENGAITQARGTSKINGSPLAADPHSLFSKVVNGTKLRYVGLVDGSVLRDSGSGAFATSILTGGSTQRTQFGVALDQILILSASKRKKDSGSVVNDLGILKPTVAPTFTVAAPPTIDVTGNYLTWTGEEGVITNNAGYEQIDVDATSFRGIAQEIYAAPLNTKVLSGGAVGTEEDIFSIHFQSGNTDKFIDVTVDFLLETPTGSTTVTDVKNYFTFKWINNDSQPDGSDNPFRQGVNEWSTLICKRKDFTRLGTDSTKHWNNVIAVRVTGTGNTTFTFYFNDLTFKGGNLGPIEGIGDTGIEYVQVNVNNTGRYVALSAIGPISAKDDVLQSYTTVTPQNPTGVDAQCNEAWIFRRGGTLDRFYRVKVLTTGGGYGAFNDQVSDTAALQINVTANEFLISLRSTDLVDDIWGVVAQYYDRVLYFTRSQLYVSEPNNPDACDSRNTANYSGSTAEIFLWAAKVNSGLILIGTSTDIYELTGTMIQTPDGFLDMKVRAIGVKLPPISDAVTVQSGIVYYLSSEGWMIFNGNDGTSLSGDKIDYMFKKFAQTGGTLRYGYYGVQLGSNDSVRASCAIAQGQFWTSNYTYANTHIIYAYDFVRKYWRVIDLPALGPDPLFAEEDGLLIGGFYSDNTIRILDTGTLYDGATKQAVDILFPVHNGNMPRNRKDGFNLKLKINTGGDAVNVAIFKDDLYPTPAQTYNFGSSGLGEVDLSINPDVGATKSFQVRVYAAAVSNLFRLEDYSIDFAERPTQLTYLRIPPTNYGVHGRKRLFELPLVVDTLGGTLSVTPYLDGIAQATQTFSTSEKLTVNYLFTADVFAKDVGFILSSATVFEFYELVTPRIIEVLPDAVKYVRIPNDNLGTTSRKRVVAIGLIIDTGGSNVTFTPIIDGVSQSTSIINTSRKQTYIHYFTSEVIGTDVGGTLSGANSFEYYGIDYGNSVSEKLPTPTKFLVIPQSDYGTPNRKRFSSYKFVINTRGAAVTFTPRIDGVDQTPASYTTTEKRTVEYFFATDTIGIDIGGKLSGGSAFEFYGPLNPQQFEKLPDRLSYFVIPEDNFGVAAKKRVRTLPLVINTNGVNIVFTPIVDGVQLASTTFNTSSKRTVFHYFTTDVFGTDFKGILTGGPFEFYGMLKPEEVEVIPVGKLFDQVGPVELKKIGKLLYMRVRVITEGTSLPFNIFMEDSSIYTGTLVTVANKEGVYETQIPKSTNGTVCRIELGPTSLPFYRFYAELKVNVSGAGTDASWVKLK